MKSLRTTLLVSILAGLLGVLVLSGVGSLAIARSSLRAQLDESLIARTKSFVSLVGHELGALELDLTGELREADLGVLVRISTQGKVVVQSPEWPTVDTGAPPILPPGSPPSLTPSHTPDGAPARMAALGAFIEMDPEDVGPDTPPGYKGDVVTVEVIGRTEAIARAQAALLAALVVGGIFAAAGAAVAVWLGVRRGLVPVHHLSRELDSLSAHELTLPSPSASYPVELRPIVSALGGLLDRVRAGIERERRFTDAAAHELRTPIAELKAITDVARRWPETDRLTRGMAEAGAIAAEMESLLESLLAAARAGNDPQAAEPVALLSLARAVAQPRLEDCRARGVLFTFEGDEQVCFHAPRGAIVAVVRNLLENAAEYTPAGGRVRVRAIAENGRATLEVENGPVNLDPAHVDHIFEPFWRADASRTDRRHRGLGLSIVASLCEGLKLRREATITPERNLRVRLSA